MVFYHLFCLRTEGQNPPCGQPPPAILCHITRTDWLSSFCPWIWCQGKWALLYILSPVTRFVTCRLLVLLVSKDISFSTNRYLLKWNSFLLFRSREPFVPTSLVFFYWLYIFWHISNLTMVGHSELHTTLNLYICIKWKCSFLEGC